MVRIRLKRMGAKKRAFYRIVAVDSRRKRDGSVIEEIGYYNPHSSGNNDYKVDKIKALQWYFKGARASDTAYALLKRAGVVKLIGEIKTKKKGLSTIISELETELEQNDKATLEAEASPNAPAADETSETQKSGENLAKIEDNAEVAEKTAEISTGTATTDTGTTGPAEEKSASDSETNKGDAPNT